MPAIDLCAHVRPLALWLCAWLCMVVRGGCAHSFVVDCKTTGATVSYKCPTNTSDAVPACTYWQDSSSGDSTWARDGCTLEYATNTHIVCACTHLTDFAGAWVQLGDRSGDVLGFTGDVTLANVAENAAVCCRTLVLHCTLRGLTHGCIGFHAAGCHHCSHARHFCGTHVCGLEA